MHPRYAIAAAILLNTLVAATSPAQSTRSLSLEEAQQIAAGHSYAVQMSRSGLQSARGARQQSLATLLPTIRIGEEWMRTDDAVGAFGARLRQERFTQADFAIAALNEPEAITNARTLIEVQQPLFSGGSYRATRRSAVQAEQAARAQVEWTRQQVHMLTAERYWGLVLANELLQVATASVQVAAGHVQRAEAAWRTGSAPRSQMLAARLRLAEMKAERIDAENRRDQAVDGLTMVLGLPAETRIVPTDSLTASASSFSDASSAELRADEQALDAQRRAAEWALRGARGGYLPQIHAFARYAWDARHPLGRDGETWMAGATLSWSVFDGFMTRGSVRQAQAQATAADIALRQLRERIERDIRDAQRQIEAAVQRTNVASVGLAHAEERLRVSHVEFDEGILTTTQLLDADVAWRAAQTRYLQALYDVHISHARRDLASGTPLER